MIFFGGHVRFNHFVYYCRVTGQHVIIEIKVRRIHFHISFIEFVGTFCEENKMWKIHSTSFCFEIFVVSNRREFVIVIKIIWNKKIYHRYAECLKFLPKFEKKLFLVSWMFVKCSKTSFKFSEETNSLYFIYVHLWLCQKKKFFFIILCLYDP